MNKILGKYRITYHNGIVQYKNLISQDDFDNIIKPTKNEINALESMKQYDVAKSLKKQLKEWFGDDFFTDGSPLFKASLNNILSLPYHQGGDTMCILTKV